MKALLSCAGKVVILNKYFHGGSYDVLKSAVCALTKALAAEWAPYGITLSAQSSEATNYMTGSVCVIDGGYTIW